MTLRLVIDVPNIFWRTVSAQSGKWSGTEEENAALALHSCLITTRKWFNKVNPDQIITVFEGQKNWRKAYTASEQAVAKIPYKGNRVKDPSMAHLYKTDTGYKGSGVQTHNLAKRGIGRAIFEQTIQKGGALAAEATTGGASGGMAGLGTHHALSSYFEKGAAKRELKAQVKSARQKESGFTSLSDIAKKSNKNENDVTNFKAK